jgi:Cellulose binding domain
VFDRRPIRRLRALVPVVALVAAVAAVALGTTAANANTLFSDDFEQPSANVWLTGGGGSWSVVTEDGSKVFRESNTAVDTAAWAGSGSGPFTSVTAKVKPNTGSGTVALIGKVANPNNFYYVALRAGRLEVGRRSGGVISSLGSMPFTATTGSWYRLTLNLFFTGTVRGNVTPLTGGSGVDVSAADPGGGSFGTAVGFWTVNASASFDDIVLSDDRVTPPTTGPPTTGVSPSAAGCPVSVTNAIAAQWPGAFQAALLLRNVSTAMIQPGWVLTFKFANGEIVTNLFSAGAWHQVGPLVSVTGPPWGGIAVGGTFTFGFIANAPNGPGTITGITFNGVPC